MMSKESMARITSPEAKAKRKDDPWTLEKRDAHLLAQTNDDVSRKREIFASLDNKQQTQENDLLGLPF
jgi:hypothetical protein